MVKLRLSERFTAMCAHSHSAGRSVHTTQLRTALLGLSMTYCTAGAACYPYVWHSLRMHATQHALLAFKERIAWQAHNALALVHDFYMVHLGRVCGHAGALAGERGALHLRAIKVRLRNRGRAAAAIEAPACSQALASSAILKNVRHQ